MSAPYHLIKESSLLTNNFTTSHHTILIGYRGSLVVLSKKVRVEFEDEQGTKYIMSVSGKLTRDKISKLVELMELMDGPVDVSPQPPSDQHTFFAKVQTLVDSEFPTDDFSSADLARIYEEKYNQPVKLSTVSTYLTRLTERGFLKRQRFSNSWIYHKVYLHPELLSR